MSNIKKQFAELVAFLEENENKKVSTLLETIYKMTESKKKESTALYDDDGNGPQAQVLARQACESVCFCSLQSNRAMVGGLHQAGRGRQHGRHWLH